MIRLNKDGKSTSIDLSKVKKNSADSGNRGSTIRLEKQGERRSIDLSKARKDSVDRKIQITLRWRAAVDLDLHAFGITKSGQLNHIFFGNKGKSNALPFITLDKDAGVGNTAGDNEENLVVHNLDEYSKIVFAANIFRIFGFLSQGDNFGDHDGSVIVTALGQNFEVPLTSTEIGKWALIASIDNSVDPPCVVNINRVVTTEPDQSTIQDLDPGMTKRSRTNNAVQKTTQNADRQNFLCKKNPAGILAILLGAFGVHKFYLGFFGTGFIMLGLTLGSFFLLLFPIALVGFIEGIIYLSKNEDAFYQDYGVNKKNWF